MVPAASSSEEMRSLRCLLTPYATSFGQALIGQGHMLYVIDISLPALPSGDVGGQGDCDRDASDASDPSSSTRGQRQAMHWTIYKRYSEFDRLRQLLLANCKASRSIPTGTAFSIPDIPPKRWRNRTPKVAVATPVCLCVSLCTPVAAEFWRAGCCVKGRVRAGLRACGIACVHTAQHSTA